MYWYPDIFVIVCVVETYYRLFDVVQFLTNKIAKFEGEDKGLFILCLSILNSHIDIDDSIFLCFYQIITRVYSKSMIVLHICHAEDEHVILNVLV